MNNDKTFPLSLDFEGKHYSGEVIPSDEEGPNGMPVYFRVILGGTLFAYLCCGDNGWREREVEGAPNGLVRAIGDYIFEYLK